MNEADIVQVFPRLTEYGFDITSPVDPAYNCIAWAAGDNTRWWWPVGFGGKSLGGYYWPTGLSSPVTLRVFQEAFASLGYESCPDGDLEPSYEKIAIYVDETGTPTHAARQLDDGTWVSKLGQAVDIRHIDVEGVCGQSYGRVALFMKRPT